MLQMLSFPRANYGEKIVVIIDDISHLARGLEAHLKLRSEIGSAGGVFERPSIEFGEDSILLANLPASVSQHPAEEER
ncbi:MAG: hypothetical protein AAFU55_01695 [Pseudomonadota bacterium]